MRMGIGLLFCGFLSCFSGNVLAQRYERLWKQVVKEKEQSLPQSALRTVEKIREKASAQKDSHQEMAAFLAAGTLRQQITPDSFYQDFPRLEQRIARAQHPVERAVYASYAAEICQNQRYRGQWKDSDKADSLPLEYWSRKDYERRARYYYDLSMADPAVLATAVMRDYEPLLQRGDEDRIFGNDLLHVLGRRALNGLDALGASRQEKMELVHRILTVYRQQRNREAELMFLLDSVRVSSRTYIEYRQGTNRDSLLRHTPEYQAYVDLMTRFADIPSVAEAYLRAAQMDFSDSVRVRLLEEGVSRYPRYRHIAALENELRFLRQPFLNWNAQECAVPGDTLSWRLQYRNLKQAAYQIYEIPAALRDTLNMMPPEDARKLLRRSGRLTESRVLPLQKDRSPYETVCDTLPWLVPRAGYYALCFEAHSPEGKQYSTACLQTSGLRLLSLSEPEGRMLDVAVVDARSGRPVPGAWVEAQSLPSSRSSQKRTTYTDVYGRTLLDLSALDHYSLRAACPGDTVILPSAGRGAYRPASLPTGRSYIYTDRAVYRPGQQVHLTGIVCRLQDGGYMAVSDTVLPLTITDVSGKVVFRDTLTTDVWGGWQTAYTLPQEGTNGRYRISAGGAQQSFRMEEYVRPNFELTLDPDNRDLAAWGDSLKVAGSVTDYNGTPAALSRVVARCEIYSIYSRLDDEKKVLTDTLQTDAEGRFTFVFAVGENPHPELQTFPYQARVQVTALHPSGEVADQRLFAQVVSLKNELAVAVPDLIDTDKGASVEFRLENTLREKITGTVFYSLTPESAPASVPPAATSGKFIANKTFRWENLQGIPSGRYMLDAWAYVQGDTLKVHRPLILCSERDTRVPVDTAFWFRVLQPEFSETEPFTCQIGSSCPEVTLYYTLCYDGKIQERKVLAFSDSLFVLKVPYRQVYGEGASLHLAFVKENHVYSRSVRITRRLPEARLHYRWQTFRNLLEPGARENWTLQLTDTAGNPVQARALFTLYDASLDAISRHAWPFSLPRVAGFYVPNWNSRYLSVASFYMPFAIESTPLKSEVWSDINRMLIDGGISAVGNLLKNSMPGVYAAAPQVARMAKTQSAADVVLEEKVVDTSMELGAGEAESSEIPETSIRRNLQETAFFQPALVTDEAGRIRLSFVVPEALTRWRLLGLAYTRDLAYCRIDTTVVTQRKLMARLFQPTYLNAGDRAVLKVTVNNLDSLADRGRLLLEVTDAATGILLSKQTQNFSITARGSAQYAFEFTPESGDRTLICRILAEGRTATDGEQRQLYVLPQTMPVTYARPFVVEGNGEHQILLPSLEAYARQGIRPSSWFLEYHTDPLFAAFQVLPLLQESGGKSAQDLAASYYAAVCSAHLWHTTPQIARWMKTWSDPQYLLQEDEWWKWVRRLNPRLWEATPWSRQKEEADDRFAGMYADSISERSQLETRRGILRRLAESQCADGSFAWMPGMNGTVAVTRQVLALLESVRSYSACPADAEIQQTERRLADRAFEYLKKRFLSQSVAGKPLTGTADRTFLWLAATHLGAGEALKIPSVKESVETLRKNHTTIPYASKPEAARVLQAYGYPQEARECLRSVEEHLVTDSLGTCFLETMDGGATAGEQHLLQHLSVMELFHTLMPEQTALYQGMQRWVLLQKRIQGWDNDYLSACAVRTLLQGLDRPETDRQTDTLLLRTSATGQETRIPAVGDGLPVVRYLQPVGPENTQPDVLTVKKHDARMTWGTAYTQYDLSPEQIALEQKEWGALSVGIHELPDTLRVGEEMKATYLIRSDRDYDYMLLRLRSAACCRPAWLTSGYRSVQGVRYYLSLEDDGMLLYFDHLPKGNYVLEVPYRIQFRGTYLHGGAEIQSYYAPEFRMVFPGKKITVHETE